MAQTKTKKTVQYYEAVGRRRSATARVRLYIGSKSPKAVNKDVKKGEIFVNDMPAAEYFDMKTDILKLMKPFNLTESDDRFSVSVRTSGGGKQSQVDAIILGISRALIKANEDFRPTLKAEGLLTRDARKRERRKPGTGGKARRQKQSPKR